ncbi:hypothetical protein PROFUN_08283 [Planoprotostelium fungivorum]|uniref:Uncharacterized protein n=1 Tax=Planoprotostelium fungivorum TaxID=1890364 RepID=A0A2P6NJY1_9EUKA|nr:hypothetical protein PROFUN_08283 [Planoprotostelium fungivorum]
MRRHPGQQRLRQAERIKCERNGRTFGHLDRRRGAHWPTFACDINMEYALSLDFSSKALDALNIIRERNTRVLCLYADLCQWVIKGDTHHVANHTRFRLSERAFFSAQQSSNPSAQRLAASVFFRTSVRVSTIYLSVRPREMPGVSQSPLLDRSSLIPRRVDSSPDVHATSPAVPAPIPHPCIHRITISTRIYKECIDSSMFQLLWVVLRPRKRRRTPFRCFLRSIGRVGAIYYICKEKRRETIPFNIELKKMDSEFLSSLHYARPLLDVVDDDWAKDQLPNEGLVGPTVEGSNELSDSLLDASSEIIS